MMVVMMMTRMATVLVCQAKAVETRTNAKISV